MKNIVFITLAVVFINLGFSQEKQEIEYGDAKFRCDDIIKINTGKDIIEFSGNVEFKTDLVEFKNADKIVYNNKTKEVIVTGTPVKVFFYGTSLQATKNSKKKAFKYKIGEKLVYLL